MSTEAMPEGEEKPPAGVRSMAIVRWAIVATMALVAVVSVLGFFGDKAGSGGGGQIYYCPMHPQIVQDHPGECPICNMTLVPKPAGPVKPMATMQAPDAGAAGKYYCPMHPWISSDDPNAECALCGGMRLLPRPPEAKVPGLVPVDLPPDRVQAIGVRTAKVARQSLGGTLRTVAVIAASERGLAQLTPRFSGWIERLFVQETGARVRKGQVVATIFSPELFQAQQEFVSALGWAGAPSPAASKHAGHGEPMTALVDDARSRLELLGVSPQEIAAIARERRPRRALELRSPVDGHVVVRNAVLGMAVQPGAPLFEIADLSTVWAVADVYESDVSRVRVGQAAAFDTTAFPAEAWKGKVQFVAPNLDPGTRTLRVRLELRNKGGKLRPGMSGNITLDLPAAEGLQVPAEAVVDTGDQQYVFVDKGGGRFEPRVVKVGGRSGDQVIIAQGLTAGETVVTTANFLIDSESRLRAAIEGRAEQPATPGHQH